MSERAKDWTVGVVCVALLMLLACCLSGCDSPLTGLPDDAYQAEADAAVDATLAADPVLVNPDDQPGPKPDDVKPGDTCPDCKGTGKVGDGTIFRPCRRCGEDGRIDERDIKAGIGAVPPVVIQLPIPEPIPEPAKKPVQPEASKRTIVMHVTAEDAAETDGWVRVWWRETSLRLASDGWKVTANREDDPKKKTWFEVCEGDRCRTMIGNQPYEAF